MLFGYPVQATGENWLHDCACESVKAIHNCLNSGKAVPKWPKLLPLAHRARLKSRTALKSRLQAYFVAAKTLTVNQREQVLKCMVEQNEMAHLLNCTRNCESLSDLPLAIQDSIKSLFIFCFDLLTPLGIRDRHYEAIYDAATDHVCPFCGLEFFDAPGGHREDLDHYLPRNIYPFAAVNLLNLAPMGRSCNHYKLEEDILRDAGGIRRRAFNPYSNNRVNITLNNSVLFPGQNSQIPQWQIDFVPHSLECDTWDSVFHLKERIQRDVLDKSYKRWLQEFAAWFVKRKATQKITNAYITKSVKEYAEDLDLQGLKAREFLRARVFRMLYEHCHQGDLRLLEFMRFLLSQTTSAPSTKAVGGN